MNNPIQYTSRSFLTALNDLNSDTELVDKPDWFKRAVAGFVDVASMWIDAVANQSYLRTAFTRQAVADLLELIDYQLTPHSTSSGTLLFYVKRTASFPVSVAKSDLCGNTSGGLAVSSLRFESRTAATITAFSETFTANAGTDELTVARSGGYYTGDLVRVSSTTTLPSPLQVSTDYYVVSISATKIKLANSLAEAFAGTIIDITDAGTGTHTITLYSYPLTCYQQTTVASQIIGKSDGATSWQEFDLPDAYILRDTVSLTINGDAWTLVDTFVYSISTDKHFKLLYKADGASYLQFGNGIYGAIPGNFDIYATYAYGGGKLTNVSTLNKVVLYAGGNTDISGVTNTTEMNGGADEEDIESAKILAPILLKTRDRFVTVEDGEALTLAYGGIGRVKILENFYGPLSCKVLCVPNGGGTLSAGEKTALQDYLIARTILNSIDVRVADPVYVTTNITAQIKMLSGYTYADYVDYFELAFSLAISEMTYEVVNIYLSQGISAAVDWINTTWTYSFTDVDYVQITHFLEHVQIPDFGTDISETPTTSLIQSIDGVDYLTTTVPASWPITFASDEISQIGTITLTEL